MDKWHVAYERIRGFCRRLGGVLVSGIDIGAGKPGEELISATCYVRSRLANEELADAIAELKTELWDDLKTVLGDRGEFVIAERVPGGERTVELRLTGEIRVYVDRIREYTVDVSPADLDVVNYGYVDYVDTVERYVENGTAYMHVQAWSSVAMLDEHAKVRTCVTGIMSVRKPVSKHKLKKLLDKLDQILEYMLKAPRRYLKAREAK